MVFCQDPINLAQSSPFVPLSASAFLCSTIEALAEGKAVAARARGWRREREGGGVGVRAAAWARGVLARLCACSCAFPYGKARGCRRQQKRESALASRARLTIEQVASAQLDRL